MQHVLFRRYPLVGFANTTSGRQPVPYHVYDGTVVFMGATAALSPVETLLAQEHVYPIRTQAGRALMALWLCDFKQASHGRHSEVQFSIFVSRSPLPAISDHPLALLRLLLTNPDVQMLIHGIWNDTPEVVAYNNDVLGLGAALAQGQIEHEKGGLRFHYAGIVQGDIKIQPRTGFNIGWALLGILGSAGIHALLTQPYLHTQTVARVGKFKNNPSAQTFTHNDKVVLQPFSQTDRLKIETDPYAQIDFRVTFVEYMQGFKFVYLNPHDVADTAITLPHAR